MKLKKIHDLGDISNLQMSAQINGKGAQEDTLSHESLNEDNFGLHGTKFTGLKDKVPTGR